MQTSEAAVKPANPRSFGILFAIVFAVLGLWPVVGSAPPRLWALGIAGILITVSVAVPQVLQPLNVLWFRFGLLLHRVVSPVALGLLYFIVILTAIMMRLRGRNLLSLKRDKARVSYWIHRSPPGPEPRSMLRQF